MLRVGAAAVAVALVTLMLVVNVGFSTPGSLGHWLFEMLAWPAFIYTLLAGVWNTADCLSEEKREGTLGLLFLTDLKGYDVVLGKLLATSLKNFYALLALFPPLAITFCLGGVTGGEFWRLVLLLTNTLFFSLTVGMLASAVSRDEQRAWTRALALLLILGAGPVLAFLAVFASSYTPGIFWNSLLAVHGASWLLLALASAILPHAWQDRPLPGVRPSPGAATHKFTQCFSILRWPLASSAQARAHPEAKLLFLNPVLWLAARQLKSFNGYLWLVILLAGGTGLITIVLGPPAADIGGFLIVAALALHYLLALWAAFQASHVFAAARSAGILELLLCTPLTVSQIAEGYFRGLERAFSRPIAVLLASEGAIAIGIVAFSGQNAGFLGLPLLIGAGFCMAMFVSDLFAVGRFGMWMGLSCKKPGQAFAKTVLYVMVLPLFSGCCIFLMPVAPVIWLVKNAIFINYGEEQMRIRFRAVLTEPSIPKAQRGRLPSVLEDRT